MICNFLIQPQAEAVCIFSVVIGDTRVWHTFSERNWPTKQMYESRFFEFLGLHTIFQVCKGQDGVNFLLELSTLA